jgi:hypothetical protein
MTDLVARLVDGYEREMGVYARLLAHARATADGASPSIDEALGALREKSRLLAEVGRIERDLAPLKDAWRRERAAAPAERVAALTRVLDRMSATIAELLALEEGSSRRFAVREGVPLARTPLAAPARGADYAGRVDLEDTGLPCVSVQG